MSRALTTGTRTLTPRQRRKLSTSPFVPRTRHPDEALGPQISKMTGVYTPPIWPTRERSQDHLQIQSRGMR